MANTLIAEQSMVFNGLGTLTYTIPSTNLYHVQFQVTEFPTSALAVVVKNGASTIFTAPVLGATQSAMQFRYSFQATAADVITVVLSSADAEDNLLNTVKSITSIGGGQ